MFRPGSKLIHPYNPELGIGVVREVEGRFLIVFFPEAEREVTLSAQGAGLTRMVMPAGSPARHLPSGEDVVVAEAREHGYLLSDGREVDDIELWPLVPADTPTERIATLRLDKVRSFRNRVQGLELMQLREAGGLGSFLGGRIELYPHQLHVAQRAVLSDPVRWLLADEVGLGKTIEACLILSALLRTGRAERALVVAPGTLAVQWLGELYRKFHQVFVMLDQVRLESVESDYGEGVNPFEVHPFAVAPLELLAADDRLLRQANEAGLDVVVVDEAHRLANPLYGDALGPLVTQARHALLLTATPLQSDREGFFGLLSLLRPDEFPSYEKFDRTIDSGEAVIACTSAVRRVDVGGLPPRVPIPVEVDRISADPREDPRAAWIAKSARSWVQKREKALVFVRDLETLEALAPYLEARSGTRVTLFHEGQSAAKRDIEVAAFRESSVPILLCTEAGGEGRNFQFCDRMVHYDLPWDPVELEQRIGRLDRIGRRSPVEIVYFKHPSAGPDLARLYERLGLFEQPAAGLDTALAPVRPAIEAAAAGTGPLDEEAVVAQVEAARDAEGRDLSRVFYRDAFRPDLAESILEVVPDDLEEKTRVYCVGAAEDLGFECVDKAGEALYYIEFGANSKIDSLPGVMGGSRFLGTFDRDEAVRMEEAEFFANGHALVEGLLLELEDGIRGRACLMEIAATDTLRGAGLLCIYKDGPVWSGHVVEANGTARPEWVEPVLGALAQARRVRVEDWGVGGESWAEGIRALAAEIEAPGKLIAAAFFRTTE